MNINQLIGANIKRLRESKQLKQSVFAKMLSISVQTLSSIENGKQNITLIQLEKIAFLLKIRISSFFLTEAENLSIEEKEKFSKLILEILNDYKH